MKTNPAPFSDGTWSCPNCGAINAVYLEQCGKCNKEKLKENE